MVFSKLYILSQRAIGRFEPQTRMVLAGLLLGAAVRPSSLFGEGYEVINSMFLGYSDVLIEDMWMLEGSLALPSLLGWLLLAACLKPMLTGFTWGQVAWLAFSRRPCSPEPWWALRLRWASTVDQPRPCPSATRS